MPKCVALLSGGLDSMLAVRIMQEQSVEVEALTFRTLFTCCQDQAGRAAHWLDVPLTAMTPDDEYLQLIRKPQFGYGRAANPCIDCRIYMFDRAREYMEQCGADFVVSGEIVGQRPKSQKRRDLNIIATHAQLDDRLLRPLCARRLPATWPEREGVVDRERLYAFCGRSRKGLMRLAEKFGFPEIPAPSTGCQLTEPHFGRKVFDLLKHDTENDRWAFELLRYGRHFRWDRDTKIIVGRNEPDNEALAHFYRQRSDQAVLLITPVNFPGPMVLITGPLDTTAYRAACGLVLRYGKPPLDAPAEVEVCHDGRRTQCVAEPAGSIDRLANVSRVRARC